MSMDDLHIAFITRGQLDELGVTQDEMREHFGYITSGRATHGPLPDKVRPRLHQWLVDMGFRPGSQVRQRKAAAG